MEKYLVEDNRQILIPKNETHQEQPFITETAEKDKDKNQTPARRKKHEKENRQQQQRRNSREKMEQEKDKKRREYEHMQCEGTERSTTRRGREGKERHQTSGKVEKPKIPKTDENRKRRKEKQKERTKNNRYSQPHPLVLQTRSGGSPAKAINAAGCPRYCSATPESKTPGGHPEDRSRAL